MLCEGMVTKSKWRWKDQSRYIIVHCGRVCEDDPFLFPFFFLPLGILEFPSEIEDDDVTIGCGKVHILSADQANVFV